MSPCVSEEINKTEKRTWLQKVLIFAGIASGVLIIAASIRLASFEDAVESICDTEVISGEKVWTMVYGLAEAKLEEFPIDYEED